MRYEELKGKVDTLVQNYLALVELVDEVGRQFTEVRKDLDHWHRHEEAVAETELAEARTQNGTPRMRGAALRRVSRAETNRQVLQYMKLELDDPETNGWISSVELADRLVGDDPEEFRYVRASYGRSLREGLTTGLYELRRTGGFVERRRTGFIDQYRLVVREEVTAE